MEEDEGELATGGDACKDNEGYVVRQQSAAGTMVSSGYSVKLGWCRRANAQ